MSNALRDSFDNFPMVKILKSQFDKLEDSDLVEFEIEKYRTRVNFLRDVNNTVKAEIGVLRAKIVEMKNKLDENNHYIIMLQAYEKAALERIKDIIGEKMKLEESEVDNVINVPTDTEEKPE